MRAREPEYEGTVERDGVHVVHRLAQYHAGRRLDYPAINPESLAEAIVTEIDRPVDYRPVETDGAARAADLLAELL